ncbi:MAG: flagellar biosynthesis anti-sigma factor FlgM [Oscillibacter sp.]|nr:flagellar biosynthesis anti-sigma factor FlgM [Oscillibacter sp.]
MLTSSGSGGVSSVGRAKGYYPYQKRGGLAQPAAEPNYDSATFSSLMAGKSTRMDVVSRLSQEVRTTTTTGDIQELRRAVSAGEYTPDPMAIAGRILLMVEE